MNKDFIGLGGEINSGKSTFARKLCDIKGFTEFSFASSLKDVISILFSWDRNLLEGDTHESREWRNNVDDYLSIMFNDKITPRIMLRKMGNFFRTYIHEDIFIMSVEKRIKRNEVSKIVISDCRHENEYNFLKRMNSTTIKIIRENTSNKNSILSKSKNDGEMIIVKNITCSKKSDTKRSIFIEKIYQCLSILFLWDTDKLISDYQWKNTIDPYLSNYFKKDITPQIMIEMLVTQLKDNLHPQIIDIVTESFIINIKKNYSINGTKKIFFKDNQQLKDNYIKDYNFDIHYNNTTLEEMDNYINEFF